MRRPLTALACLFVLLSACGNDGATRTSGSSPAPGQTTAVTDEAAGATPEAGSATTDPGASGAPKATAPGGPGGTSTATPAPVSTAQPGRVNRPRTGRYIYDLSGSQSNPFTVGEEPYPPDSRMFVELTASGDEYTSKTTTNADQTETTEKARWEQDRVLLTYLAVRVPNIANFQCTITPPVQILKMPMAAGAFPTQRFENTKDNCSGTVDINVIGQEDAKDATGKVWKTWKISNSTTYTFQGGFQGKASGFIWMAPDLGTVVRADERNEGRFEGGTFKSHNVTVLRQRP
jgi:hypothetical protein